VFLVDRRVLALTVWCLGGEIKTNLYEKLLAML
jgi:hypothetical protein